MAEIHEWQNGDNGGIVKKIIDSNFRNINTQLNRMSYEYVYSFTLSDWKNGEIVIDYSSYSKDNPCVNLYIKTKTGYSLVYNGYEITSAGIKLQSDIAYEGKVVIR